MNTCDLCTRSFIEHPVHVTIGTFGDMDVCPICAPPCPTCGHGEVTDEAKQHLAAKGPRIG